MALLTPNSYGTAKGVLREFNPCHEPGGRPTGGQFARKGSCAGTSAPPRATSDKLRSFDLKVEGDLAAHLKAVFGRALSKTELEGIARQMLADAEGVEFNTTVSVRPLINEQGKVEGSVAIFKFIGTDGEITAEDEAKRPTSLIRAFVRKDGKLVARHSSFEKNASLPPGFGKDMLRSHMQAYQRLGVDRIETHANISVGTYAWAKYGFVAARPEEITTLIEDAVEGMYGRTVYDSDQDGKPKGRGVGIGDMESRLLKNLGRSKDPRVIWALADARLDGVKVGKALLLEANGWDAYLDITGRTPLSKESLDRFWAYVGRSKRPKLAAPPRRAREVVVVLIGEAGSQQQTPGELCEWDPHRQQYSDRRIWEELLDGDGRFTYDLRDPSQRRVYRNA